jgi:hypothetical protein
MAALPGKLAAAIVARYPRGWRERYADEMLALFEDRGVHWRDAIDLVRGCLSEWRVSLADPETHPVAGPIALTSAPIVYATVLALAFQAIAGAMTPALEQVIGSPAAWTLNLLVVAPVLVCGRLILLTHGRLATITPRSWLLTWPETWLWIAVLLGGELSMAWRGQPFSRSWNLICTFPLCAQLLANTGDRGRRLHAYSSVRKARRQLIRAKLRFRLEQSRPAAFANGSALERARADVDRRSHELELAREKFRGSVRSPVSGLWPRAEP